MPFERPSLRGVDVFMMTMMKGRHSEREIPGGREGGMLDLPLNPLSHPIRGGFLSGGGGGYTTDRRTDDEEHFFLRRRRRKFDPAS